jgi:hypothetical protein
LRHLPFGMPCLDDLAYFHCPLLPAKFGQIEMGVPHMNKPTNPSTWEPSPNNLEPFWMGQGYALL